MHTLSSALPLTVITHEFFPMKGGIATFVEEIAQACGDLGLPIEVWAPHRPAAVEKRFPFPVRRVPLRGSQDFSCQMRMAREMIANRRQLRRCIVYLPEPGPLLAMTYLQFFKAFKPARLLLTFHGSEVQSFASRPGARILVHRLIQASHRISTTSRFVRQLLCERFPAAASKTIVTAGAARSTFRSCECIERATGDKVVIVTVGRLHPRKGQMHVIDALDALPPALARHVEYWIIGRGGRGDYEAQLRRRADSAKVPVVFLGSIDDEDLISLYRRADIFAMTSVDHGHSMEGFGLVYLEAGTFGLPVVAHSVGGVPEAVIHGETGLLVSPGDPSALTEAFHRLITDVELRRRLGSNGRRWAQAHSWTDSARRLLDGVAPLRLPLAEHELVRKTA